MEICKAATIISRLLLDNIEVRLLWKPIISWLVGWYGDDGSGYLEMLISASISRSKSASA